jgi:hypothetical protein
MWAFIKDRYGSHSCSASRYAPGTLPAIAGGRGWGEDSITSITRGSAATLRPIGIVRAVGVAWSVSSPAPTAGFRIQ